MNIESQNKIDLDYLEFDITDFCLSLWCCCLSSKKIIFDTEHLIIVTNTPVCTEKRIIHYLDLDKVETNICFGCSSFNSSFGPIEPGFCGCNKKKLVEEIVEELHKRINYFNNKPNIESKINEINLLKKILDNFNLLNNKVDKIIDKLETGNEKI
jgi:hypothetical protein